MQTEHGAVGEKQALLQGSLECLAHVPSADVRHVRHGGWRLQLRGDGPSPSSSQCGRLETLADNWRRRTNGAGGTEARQAGRRTGGLQARVAFALSAQLVDMRMLRQARDLQVAAASQAHAPQFCASSTPWDERPSAPGGLDLGGYTYSCAVVCLLLRTHRTPLPANSVA